MTHRCLPLSPIRLASIAGALLCLALAGCSKSVTEKAMESDSNGYRCSAGHKFYTDRSVFAEKCPVCQTVSIVGIYGYVCEKEPAVKYEGWKPGCGAISLLPRGRGVKCEKCGNFVDAVIMPSSKMFEAWGATKATREQVSFK